MATGHKQGGPRDTMDILTSVGDGGRQWSTRVQRVDRKFAVHHGLLAFALHPLPAGDLAIAR